MKNYGIDIKLDPEGVQDWLRRSVEKGQTKVVKLLLNLNEATPKATQELVGVCSRNGKDRTLTMVPYSREPLI